MERGKIDRTGVAEVKLTGRNTQGVTFAKPDDGDRIIAITLNKEDDDAADVGADETAPEQDAESDGAAAPGSQEPPADAQAAPQQVAERADEEAY